MTDILQIHKIMYTFNPKVEANLSKGIKQTNMKEVPVLKSPYVTISSTMNTHNFLKNKKPSPAF